MIHNLKTRLISRVALGVIAIGGGVAGYYLNSRAQKNMDEAALIYNDYIDRQSTKNNATLETEYRDSRKAADDELLMRNISYGLGLLGALGLGLTFTF